MATESKSDIASGKTWQNVVDTHADAASADVLIQNKGRGMLQVVFGGTEPTDDSAGVLLESFDSVQGNAAAIWIRSSSSVDSEAGVTLI